MPANDIGSSDVLRDRQWTGVNGQAFRSPVSAVHTAGTFFVADSGLGQVIAFDEQGKLRFTITNELERPSGLALAGEHLLIADAQASTQQASKQASKERRSRRNRHPSTE